MRVQQEQSQDWKWTLKSQQWWNREKKKRRWRPSILSSEQRPRPLALRITCMSTQFISIVNRIEDLAHSVGGDPSSSYRSFITEILDIDILWRRLFWYSMIETPSRLLASIAKRLGFIDTGNVSGWIGTCHSEMEPNAVLFALPFRGGGLH